MSQRWERTLKQSVEFIGIGLHTGKTVRMSIEPSKANAGIVFNSKRHEVPIKVAIPSIATNHSQLCTQLQAQDQSWRVSTVEHLLAAFSASGVTNACVTLDPINDERIDEVVEVPIMDGSSLPFLQAIQQVGLQNQSVRLPYIRIDRPVQVLLPDKGAWLLPLPFTMQKPILDMTIHVDFVHKGLGTHIHRFILDHCINSKSLSTFTTEIAPARTFTFEDEIDRMRLNNLALGGSLDNAVVFQNPVMDSNMKIRVLNPQGLRMEREWVQHKVLDCIGDLGLTGIPIHGQFIARCPGHSLTHKLLETCMKDTENYSVIKTE